MIDLVKKYFGKSSTSSDGSSPTSHNIKVATCAIFLEMAHIDGEFSESEQQRILTILKNSFQLSDETAVALMEKSSKELNKSIDLWQFTSLIVRNYTIEERIKIIEVIWEIIYADGKLDKHEDYLVHKLAKLLRITHKQIIDAKLKILKKNS